MRVEKSTIAKKGDILVDRHGNKMVVLDPVSDSTGDCYVLLNGRVKLINMKSSFIVGKETISNDRDNRQKA